MVTIMAGAPWPLQTKVRDTERRAIMCVAAEWGLLDDPRGQERRSWTVEGGPERSAKSR
jgi:hypothetical protein